MADIKKVKIWKEKQSLVKITKNDIPQFEILFENADGIKSITRIKDKRIFDLNVNYPALRGDYFRFTEFKQDKITVDFEILVDNQVSAVGLCQINDILIQDGFFTDARLEKTIKEMALIGINIKLKDDK